MKTKRILVSVAGVVFLLLCLHVSIAAEIDLGLLDKKRQAQATSVASTWFKALNDGDVANVLSLSDVPFAFNGKKVIDDTSKLKKAYTELSESKGKVSIKPHEVKVTSTNSKIDKECVPQHYFIVNIVLPSTGINESSRSLKVCIKPGDAYKVIGFSKY